MFWGIIIPSTFAATAVLIIAPKFLVSVTPSSNKYVFGELLSNVVDTSSSVDNILIGDNIATAPWWFLLIYFLNFSLGTNEYLILLLSNKLTNDLNKLLFCKFDLSRYTLDISFDDSIASIIDLIP